ncbi:hypothetical protein A2U01_0060926, partial [Trifolium medium]|nr:hypothetical protein [Trifolium medium]
LIDKIYVYTLKHKVSKRSRKRANKSLKNPSKSEGQTLEALARL